MKNHEEDDFTLLGSVFKGLNVYFNYSGTSECLNISSSSDPTLGEQGWNYQVINLDQRLIPKCCWSNFCILELHWNGYAIVFERNKRHIWKKTVEFRWIRQVLLWNVRRQAHRGYYWEKIRRQKFKIGFQYNIQVIEKGCFNYGVY